MLSSNEDLDLILDIMPEKTLNAISYFIMLVKQFFIMLWKEIFNDYSNNANAVFIMPNVIMVMLYKNNAN